MNADVRVIECLYPGACPPLPDGPTVSLVKGGASAYIEHYAAFPPNWPASERLKFEMDREDAVMLLNRSHTPPRQRERSYQWLLRRGLDNLGRPRTWSDDHKSANTTTPGLALAV